jgi:hypothetical protein
MRRYKTTYKIIGKDRRYGTQESYGEFDSLRDCLYHMETLNRSFGNIIKFKWEEIVEDLT